MPCAKPLADCRLAFGQAVEVAHGRDFAAIGRQGNEDEIAIHTPLARQRSPLEELASRIVSIPPRAWRWTRISATEASVLHPVAFGGRYGRRYG